MLQRQISFVLAMVVIGAAGFSCNDTKPPADKDAFKPALSGSADAETPVPPKDAQYTIACKVFSEDGHVQDSRDARKMLYDATNLKKWYVVHSADHSTLYYGFYRTMDPHDPTDAAEGKRAIDDQNTIRGMQDSQGNRIFSESLIVAVDSADPEANPAWDIMRSHGYWSVEIAVFKNSPDRKQRAVQAVREARSSGVDAYYYHGPNASVVCIGSWPQEAAVEVNENTDPDAPLVVTSTPLAPEVADPLNKMGIKTIAPHVDIVDPTLTEVLNKWKEHSVNGYTLMRDEVDPITREHRTVAERPFLFKIPETDPLDAASPSQSDRQAPIMTVPPEHAPGTGQLPSLGD